MKDDDPYPDLNDVNSGSDLNDAATDTGRSNFVYFLALYVIGSIALACVVLVFVRKFAPRGLSAAATSRGDKNKKTFHAHMTGREPAANNGRDELRADTVLQYH